MLKGLDTMLFQHQYSVMELQGAFGNSLSSNRAAVEAPVQVLRRSNARATFSKLAGSPRHQASRIYALQEQSPSKKSEASGNRKTSKANVTSTYTLTSPSYLPTSSEDTTAVSAGFFTLLGQIPADQAQGHHDYEIRSEIRNLVNIIKGELRDLADDPGVITHCAYDTAWVARVTALDGSPTPQFPETLDWVLKNQLPDGSWGDPLVDMASDRLLSTLCSVVALVTWKTGETQIQKGEEYLWSNIDRLKGTTGVLMPAGYELIFPSLMDDAKNLGLDLPYDSDTVKVLKDMGRKKRERIPLEMLYARVTTLMHSLEGLKGLDIDWQRVLKLQIADGSIMASPAATAFALMETGDEKCNSYLKNLVRKFGGAVPNFYPLDNFQVLWSIDILERLGIARYFQDEIEPALASVYNSVWSDKVGIAWTRLISLVDIDCTSVGFRLLRMHGYDVQEGVFNHFRRDGEFVCYEGQLVQGISDMFALYRATEVPFPGEKTIQDAYVCSKNFLENALAINMNNADKWAIKKDLYGEVQRRLNYPLHSVLPRLEINDYMDRYGIEDPWVAKAVYRLPTVNNQNYLALAKADTRLCQSYYLKELLEISEWLRSSKLDSWAYLYESAMQTYFVFAAEIWEPEYSILRTVAAKSAILALYLRSALDESYSSLRGQGQVFLEALARWDPQLASNLPGKFQTLLNALWETVNTFTEEACRMQGRDVSERIRSSWERLATALAVESEWRQSSTVTSLADYMDNARVTLGAEPAILTSFFFTDVILDDNDLAQIDRHSDFWKNSCSYARLAIDRGSSEENVPAIYSEEYATLSRSEVYELLQSQQEDLIRELNRSLWGSSSSSFPTICRRLVRSISRVMPKISDLRRDSQNSPHFTADEKQLLFQLHHIPNTKDDANLNYSSNEAAAAIGVDRTSGLYLNGSDLSINAVKL